jgi:hypothetical protein
MIRPLISLVVPVWGEDDMVAELVSVVSLDATAAEWVVAAVELSERLIGGSR